MSRIICITGTDTGVGKTVLTILLLAHLRSEGVHALAMKPFCTGSTEDIDRIRAIQGDELPMRILNPFYFKEPLAPFVAATRARRKVDLAVAIEAVRKAAIRCECLLVEGAGGALTPLTRTESFADLTAAVQAETVVVGPNQLGVLNHILLTIEALQLRGIGRVKVILMESAEKNLASLTNFSALKSTLKTANVFAVPKVERTPLERVQLVDEVKKIKKTLAQICDPDNVCPVVRTADKSSVNERLKKRK